MLDSAILEIKKYPNRRYYDATRSRHVTLDEVHDLVRDGRHVRITDSRTGEDITNTVLMQIILDKEHVKLDLFPSTMLHLIIRSNRRALRDTLEQLFGPFMDVMAASQKQFDAYLRQAGAVQIPTPLDWANRMMEAFAPPRHNEAPADDGAEPPEANDRDEAIRRLQRQIEELSRQVEKLATPRPEEG